MAEKGKEASISDAARAYQDLRRYPYAPNKRQTDSHEWWNEPYLMLFGEFQIPTDIQSSMVKTCEQTELYTSEIASHFLEEDVMAQLAVKSMEEIYRLLKESNTRPKTTVAAPTWIQQQIKLQQLWQQRFPGIPISGMPAENYALRQEYSRLSARAGFDDIYQKPQEPMPIREAIKMIYSQVRRAQLQLLVDNDIPVFAMKQGIGQGIYISKNVLKEAQIKDTPEDPVIPFELDYKGQAYLILSKFLSDPFADEGVFSRLVQSDAGRKFMIHVFLYENIAQKIRSLMAINNRRESGEVNVFTSETDEAFSASSVSKWVVFKDDRSEIAKNIGNVAEAELYRYFIRDLFMGGRGYSLKNIQAFFSHLHPGSHSISLGLSGRSDSFGFSHSPYSRYEGSRDTEGFDKLDYEGNHQGSSTPFPENVLQVIGEPTTRLAPAEAELERLQKDTFEITGPQKQLDTITELVFPEEDGTRLNPYVPPNLSNNAIRIHSLIPISPVKGKRKDIFYTPLALPRGFVPTKGSTISREDGEFPAWLFTSNSGYFAGQMNRDNLTVNIEAVMARVEGQSEEFFSLSTEEKDRLGQASVRLAQMGREFSLLATLLHTLSQQSTVTTVDVERDIRSAFQYTIVGQDETIERGKFRGKPFESKISNFALGYDEATHRLRVQCDHAAAITKEILRMVFSEDSVHLQSKVLVKDRQPGKIITGMLHKQVIIRKGEKYVTLDTSPPEDNEIIQEELKGTRISPLVAISMLDRQQFVTTQLRALITSMSSGQEFNAQEEIRQLSQREPNIEGITGRTSDSEKLYRILALLFQQADIPPQLRALCKKYLEGIIDTAESISKLHERELGRFIRDMKHQYGSQFNQFNYRSLAIVANALLPYFQ